jgi:hypothetical protein
MTTVIIDGVEYIPKPREMPMPTNKIGATHFAILPDKSIIFYRIEDTVLVWKPISKCWDAPSLVPYTLNTFDT